MIQRLRYRCADRQYGHAWAVLSGMILAAALAATPALADPVQSVGSNTVGDSGNSTQGIVELNQDAGDFNNQGNAVAIAVTSGDHSAALATIILDSEQAGASSSAPPIVQTNAIDSSFNGASGIAQVNQATGQGNVELNAVAIAFAPDAVFSPALTDVELKGVSGQVANGGGSSAAPGSNNTMNNSFNNFRGIAQVAQVAGDSNVVINVVAVAVGGGGA